MNPDAIHNPKPKHYHQNKRPAVTDQWQGNASNRQHRDCHTDILKNVRENQRTHPDDKQKAKLIARKKSDEETSQKQQPKSSYQEHST